MPNIQINPNGGVLSVKVKISTSQNAAFLFRVTDMSGNSLGKTELYLGMNADEATHVFNIPVGNFIDGFIHGIAEIEDNGAPVNIVVSLIQGKKELKPVINLTMAGEAFPTFHIK